MKTKKLTLQTLFLPILVVIMIWGIFLRAPEVISRNYLFGHDHGRDYLAAYNIVVNHKMTLIGAEAGSGVAGINGIFHGPGYFYLIALAYSIFQGNPIGAQLFMLFFGIAALVVAAWMGQKMFGKTGSVLFLFFIAVSPLIVSQSRFIWSSHPITVFILLALYFVYKIPDKPKIYAPLSVFIAGFTYNSQLGVSVPLTVSILLALIFVYRVRDMKTYLYSCIALILAFSPMILFEARHGFMAVHSAIQYVSGGAGVGVPIFSNARLSSHMWDYWNNFFNTFTYEFGFFPLYFQKIVLYCTFPFVIFGLSYVTDEKQKRFVRFLLLMIGMTCIAYLLLNNVVWDYYLTHLRIGYILLYVAAGVSLYRHLSKSRISKIGICVGAVFVTVISSGSIFRQYVSYTRDIHDFGVYDKISGKRFVIDTIYADAGGSPFSVFVFMPSVYTWPYDYLFKTYGKQKYGYEPGNEKKGTAYLIVEPDLSEPWRQKGWLETVVQGGDTVWTKTLLNGLLLEKRIYPYD
jgi:hypothetical protein